MGSYACLDQTRLHLYDSTIQVEKKSFWTSESLHKTLNPIKSKDMSFMRQIKRPLAHESQ